MFESDDDGVIPWTALASSQSIMQSELDINRYFPVVNQDSK